MNARTYAVMFLALASAAPALLAQALPKPAPELAQLSIFEGTWHCTGKVFATAEMPAHATTAIAHGAKAVGGYWIHVTYDETQPATQSAPAHFGAFMGYDAASKQFVQMGVDRFGHAVSTSLGWSGDTLIYEGSENGVNGKPVMQRDNFTRKGTDGLIHAGEMQGADGKWIKTDEETCRRVK